MKYSDEQRLEKILYYAEVFLLQFEKFFEEKFMEYDLSPKVENFIKKSAEKFELSKVILFGSRARGDNSPRSDIDLAVDGGDILNFHFEMEDEAPTLLEFDIINLSEKLNKDFLAEIERDGVILYEKV